MSASSKKNYQTAEILYAWRLIPSSFPPLKQSHIHLMHDHGIFRHCLTSSVTLNNWGKNIVKLLAISQTINSKVRFNSMFNTTNDSKIFITSKTQTTQSNCEWLQIPKKLTWLNDNIISKNRAITCNMIFEMSFLMNAFL